MTTSQMTPEFDKLYCAYRRAKAMADLAFYTAPGPGNMTDQESDAYCTAQHSSAMAVMRHPASNAIELALKMEVFMAEELYEGNFSMVKDVAFRLADDAHGLAYGR
ncbi:MAG: hypothetical protein ACK4ZW_07300 [Blastomonas sp.]